MNNVWLEIELSDYENHMSLSSVAQSQYLSQNLSKLIEFFEPRTLAILGSCGGNGLERIDLTKVEKVVCVDINQNYLNEAKKRYKNKFQSIEFVCQDIASPSFSIESVDLIYGGLIFEYVDLDSAVANVSKYINKKGRLAVVLQQKNESIPEVSPSKYKSLEKLSQIFRFVSTAKLTELCKNHGLELISENEVILESGKKFSELIYQKS